MWRRFNFFERHALEPSELSGRGWVCGAAGTGGSAGAALLFFGGEDGTVAAADARLRPVAGWRAHDARCTHLVALTGQGRALLVSLGEEEAGAPLPSTTIKVWDASRLRLDEREAGAAPPCARVLKLFAPKFNPSAVHAFTAVEDGNAQLAFVAGLASGHVYVIRAELGRERTTRSRLLVSADAAALGGGGVLCVGAAARREGTAPLLVYAATRSAVACADVASAAPRVQQLDTHGATGAKASAMSEQGEFILGRPEAVYFYGPDGRGACLPVPGDKRLLACSGGVLLVLSAGASDAGASSATSSADPAAPGAPLPDASCQLSLFDLRARVLAHAAPLPDVAHALCAPGRVTVLLSDDAPPFALRERDAPAKVEALIKRGLYPTALALLTAEGAPPAALSDVRRRFGDHLASKRDFEGALAQWIGTIGAGTPASHVIKALLDARRPADVARFLEALHAAGHATAEHTTLLLHCYAAAKDAAKLDAFLAGPPIPGEAPPAEEYCRRFDVPTVLRVCRAAGYPQAALAAAARAGDAASRLEILMDDLSAFDDALALLESIPPAEADAGLRRYGRRLLAARPAAAAALLLRGVARGAGRGGGGLARAAAAAPLFAERPRALLRFLQSALEACGGAAASGDDVPPADAAAAAALHATLLELLLAERLAEDAGVPMAPADVSAEVAEEAAARAEAALRLLRDAWASGRPARYDAPHALVLCQSAAAGASAAAAASATKPAAVAAALRARADACARCVRFLLERLRLYPELLRSHAAAGDARGLLDAAQRLGARADPALWRDALAHLADATHAAAERAGAGADAAAASDDGGGAEIREALDHVERHRLLPPLAALAALARSPRLPLAVARGFVGRALAAEAAAAAADAAAAARLGAETARMRAELRELRTRPRVFQNNRCATCTLPLDAPAQHFLCMHSFHTRCLAETERECPKCAPETRGILEVKRALAAAAADQDRFFQALENSDDGFAVVAEHYGRGIL